jgi:F-type H+-transporting ATPase subunit c
MEHVATGMTSGAWLAITVPLSLGMAAMASAFGLSRAVSAAMEAMARQPEASGQIQTAMVIGCALIEALTIYVLVISFVIVLMGKIS